MENFFEEGMFDVMHWAGGFGIWFVVFQVLRFVLVVALIVVVIRMFANRSNQQVRPNSRAIEVLKERYAAGEIDEEEYKNKLKNLKD